MPRHQIAPAAKATISFMTGESAALSATAASGPLSPPAGAEFLKIRAATTLPPSR